jgi:hypothetical protein
MKKVRFQELLKQQHQALLALTATKGEEYANAPDDQLANFRRLGLKLGLPMEKVLMVYLTKHLDSIEHYIKPLASGHANNLTAKALSEPIDGRIDDAILYLILLKAIVIERREVEGQP